MAKNRLIRVCGLVLGTVGGVLGALYGPLVYLHVTFGVAAAWFFCWAGIELGWHMANRSTRRHGPLLCLATRPREICLFISLVPTLYVASFGPVCRFVYDDDWTNIRRLAAFYAPLFWAVDCFPEIGREILTTDLWTYGGLTGVRVWRTAHPP